MLCSNWYCFKARLPWNDKHLCLYFLPRSLMLLWTVEFPCWYRSLHILCLERPVPIHHTDAKRKVLLMLDFLQSLNNAITLNHCLDLNYFLMLHHTDYSTSYWTACAIHLVKNLLYLKMSDLFFKSCRNYLKKQTIKQEHKPTASELSMNGSLSS